MTQLLENMLPGVMSDGINTNKSLVIGGISSSEVNNNPNFDMSGSSGFFKFPTGMVSGALQAVSTYTTTAAPTSSQSGAVLLWNAAAGFTITLPAPVVGVQFLLAVLTSVTSSNHKVITNSASVFLVGGVSMGEVAATTAPMFAADGTSIRSVTMNGTTTGGLIGTYMEVTCINATQWLIQGQVLGSGTLATPFATS